MNRGRSDNILKWPLTLLYGRRYVLPVVLIGLAIFLIFKVISAVVAQAFITGTLAHATSDDIRQLLDLMASQRLPRQGAVAELAEIRRNDGLPLKLIVAEGEFGPSSIDPPHVWSDLLKQPSILVSSGDELLRNDGGISKPISIGCGIKQVIVPLATGGLAASNCEGPYKRVFPNIKGVRSAIIKAWSGVDEKADCEPNLISETEGPQSDYSKCISDAIKSSLTSLFGKWNTDDIDTIILPALGTGTGGISKGVFYAAVFDTLDKCLNSKHGCYRYLPNRLVFSIWRGDGITGWNATRDAIARTLAEFGNTWSNQYAPEQTASKAARYLGIVLVLLIFVLLVQCRHRLPLVVAAHVPKVEGTGLFLVVVGWGIAGPGAIAIFSDIVDSLVPSEGPTTAQRAVFNVGLGIVAAASCGLIERATEAFRHD